MDKSPVLGCAGVLIVSQMPAACGEAAASAECGCEVRYVSVIVRGLIGHRNPEDESGTAKTFRHQSIRSPRMTADLPS